MLPSGIEVAFCGLTQLGLLRLLTNEKVMGNQRRSHAQAWADYLQLVSQKAIVYMEEPQKVDDILAAHCRRGGSSPSFWTDAYLAAFAKACGLTFATFDKGFKRFPGLKLELLP